MENRGKLREIHGLQKILADFESTDGVLCAVESVVGLLGDGTLGDDVKTEDWAKDPEIGRKCIKWKIGRKNKILKNLKQTEFE